MTQTSCPACWVRLRGWRRGTAQTKGLEQSLPMGNGGRKLSKVQWKSYGDSSGILCPEPQSRPPLGWDRPRPHTSHAQGGQSNCPPEQSRVPASVGTQGDPSPRRPEKSSFPSSRVQAPESPAATGHGWFLKIKKDLEIYHRASDLRSGLCPGFTRVSGLGPNFLMMQLPI